MDQGVIGSLKAHYRLKIVRECIKVVNKNETLPKISIPQSMKDLVSSWNTVSNETFVNCFKKPGINESNHQMAETDDDGQFKSLTEELKRLRELDPLKIMMIKLRITLKNV